ncbi:MAG: NAD(P)-dependent oxidoreductase [Pseudomonadota bacterium]
MKTVLMTGAAGGIATWLRPRLVERYGSLRVSDIKTPENLDSRETFVAADLANLAEVEAACDGIDGIVHLGGHSIEGPWDTILNANIIGTYNLFEAARRKGVKRVIFASSNHAVGYYPRDLRIPPDVVPRPDSRYGVSKVFGEGLGAMYAYKHGLGVMSLRIGNVNDQPVDARRLAIWISPDDIAQLCAIGLETPELVYEVVYATSDNDRSWYENARAYALGYRPKSQSEDYAKVVLASEEPAGDPVAEYYQGGTFCADEYTADFDKIRAKD